MSVIEQLRQRIETSYLTQIELSDRTEVSARVISKFVTGDRGINNRAMDKLCKFFKLELK